MEMEARSAAVRMRAPWRRARLIIGVAIAMSTTMIPMTTRTWISVNPSARRRWRRGRATTPGRLFTDASEVGDVVGRAIEAVRAGADEDEGVLLAGSAGGVLALV